MYRQTLEIRKYYGEKWLHGDAGNAKHENTAQSKMEAVEKQDMKIRDNCAGAEIASQASMDAKIYYIGLRLELCQQLLRCNVVLSCA